MNWLAWLVGRLHSPEDALWKSGPNKYQSMFRILSAKLNLESLKLSPASLRAGGATFLIDQGVEGNRIRFIGRWANRRSLEHYIQVARVQQISLSILEQLADRLAKLQLKTSKRGELPFLGLPHGC